MNDRSECIAQEILEVEQIMDEAQGLQLTEENIELVLDEIRPYLVGEVLCHQTYQHLRFCTSLVRMVQLIASPLT